jgi:CRP/FNR family transcriptional regulator
MTDLWNLHRLELFTGLEPHDLEKIGQIITTQRFAAQDFIFYPGSESYNQFYLLHQGRVKTYNISQKGKEKVLHIFLPGDAFGGLLLPVDNKEQQPWAQALDDVLVGVIDEPAFKRLMQTCPDLVMNLLRYMTSLHANDMHRLESLLHTKAVNRLVRILLYLGERLGCGDAEQFEIDPGFTHEDLARMAGVARTTVSESISQLRRAGVLHSESRPLIVNRRAAEQFLQKT